LLGGVAPAVIPNSHLLSKDLSGYKAIFMQGNDRAPQGCLERVAEYVRNGGILVVACTSLRREDDFDTPLNPATLLGCTRPAPIEKTCKVDLSRFNLEGVQSVARRRDGIFGYAVEVGKAQVLARDEEHRAAVTVNRAGKGKAYLIACELPAIPKMKLLQSILSGNGIEPEVSVKGEEELLFVERHLLGEEGRYVLYLHNWGGGSHRVNVKIGKKIPSGVYVIRDLETSQELATMGSEALVSKGLEVSLSSQTPLALLLERGGLEPLKLRALSEEQRFWLDYIARPSPKNVPTKKRVLIDSAHLNQYTRIHLLTAAKALEDDGYEVNVTLGGMTEEAIKTYTDRVQFESLNEYGILFMGGTRAAIEEMEAEKIKKWVEEGGSLFACGNWYRGPHGWLNNYVPSRKLYSLFGATVENLAFTDDRECLGGESRYPVFRNIASDVRTRGVGSLCAQGMALLGLTDPAWEPLVMGNESSNYPGRAALAVRELGKGKMVLCGDAAWIKPTMIEKGDNKRLFMNLMRWLST